MGTREEQAEAVSSPSSSPHCVQCGRPVVLTHKCPATPSTSRLHGPPAGWRDEVEAERHTPRLDQDDAWEEQLLPLDPVDPAEPPPPAPPP